MHDVAVPDQLAQLREALAPRAHRVFFARLDRVPLGIVDRLVANLPAFPGVEGDFRDWDDIEGWAEGVARELRQGPKARSTA